MKLSATNTQKEFEIMLAFNMLDSVFHVHIPRTGGRWIRALFKRNNWNTMHDDFGIIAHGVEEPHLPYPQWSFMYGVDEKHSFTVVRHPYDRLISSLMFFNQTNQYHSKDHLFYDLSLTSMSTPQHHYVGPRTQVYKYEDGLDESFVMWVNDVMKINLRFYDDIIYPTTEIDIQPKQNLIESINPDWVKEYYPMDYSLFGYN